MSKVTIRLLGIGAVKLSDGEKTIYVDAFTQPNYVKPHHVEKADLILLTHDDQMPRCRDPLSLMPYPPIPPRPPP